MYDYCVTWFKGEWANWMVYCNKLWLANTSSNIKSLVNVLKRDYFERRKEPKKTAIAKVCECIDYYSTGIAEFKTIPEIKTKTLSLAIRSIGPSETFISESIQSI